MPPKVTLVRQDGSRLDATPEQAEKLKLLGYKEESPEEQVARNEATAAEDYYTSTGNQITTAVEGTLRGATLGLSDYAFSDAHTGKRAAYNPGIAAASEIVGGIGVEFVPGLNLVAPASVIGRAAKAAVPGAGIARTAVRGAMEGGAFGGAMAADHAYISGDPVTSEAVMHGIGWGALFGAGLGAVGSGMVARGEAKMAAGAKLEAEAAAYKGVEGVESNLALREAELAGERAALAKQEAQVRAKGVRFESAPGTYATTAEPAFVGFKSEAKRVAANLRKSTDTVEALLSNNRKKLAQLGVNGTMSVEALGKSRLELQSAFNKVAKAMNAKSFNGEKLAAVMKEYEKTAAAVANKAGLTATDSGRRALMEYAQAKVVQKQLAKFPHSAEAFATMSGQKAEDLFAALSSIKKATNYKAFGEALETQANKFQEAVGLTPNGVDGLRAAWNASRKALKAEKTAIKFSDIKTRRAELDVRGADLAAERAKLAAEKAKEPELGKPGLIKRGVADVGGYIGYKAAQAVLPAHPIVALGVGAKVRKSILDFGVPKTPQLIAARNATLGRVKQAVGKYQAKAGAGIAKAAPKLSPLAMRLDGTIDDSTKNVQQLARNRIMEFAQAAPHVKDTLYRGIEPIAVEQPELGAALHDMGVKAFTAMRSLMPADPGVVSGLKSIWNPSPIQSTILSKQLEVWHDPVGVVEDILINNQYDPIKIKALKEIAPWTYQELRVEMIGKIQEPGFLDNMDYRTQVALGSLLDIPIHSSMRPEFIAASQALHTTRNQPLPTPPITTQGQSNGGRPSESSGATAAQITTSR